MSSADSSRVCPHCGAQISLTDEVCPKCLATLTPITPTATRHKSPRIAAVASVVWPGLGQLYLDQMRRGVLLIVFAAVFAFLALLGARTVSDSGLLVFLLIWAYGIYDAFNIAKAIDEGAI